MVATDKDKAGSLREWQRHRQYCSGETVFLHSFLSSGYE